MTTASGARSVRSLEHSETFHPVVGPMEEARVLHVAQSRLVERAGGKAGTFVVWDVGLGAAANAIAAIEALSAAGVTGVELHSFDCETGPLEFACSHAGEIGYITKHAAVIEELLRRGMTETRGVSWRLHRGDFRALVHEPPAPAPDAILYDPYSPSANPGMWTLDHFRRLRRVLDPARPCTLTSYSRSTAVRVTLVLAGFLVGRGRATGEKDETTVAATHRDLIESPLGPEWLERVARSTRGAPLCEGRGPLPISDEDFAMLRTALLKY